MQTIDFKHDYFKLLRQSLTTIRGKSWFNKFNVGEVVKITLRNEFVFSAQIFMKSIIRIDLADIYFLKHDAEYKGLEINTKDQFLNLINSFYPRNRFEKTKATIKTELCVISLRRID